MNEIPNISKEKLEGLMKKIKPVVRFSKISNSKGTKLEEDEEGDLYYLRSADHKNSIFTWDPKPKKVAREVHPRHYTSITTYHEYGYIGFFKPSIAEVLAQLPEKELDRCVAFETHFRGVSENSTYHVAETYLYERKKLCH